MKPTKQRGPASRPALDKTLDEVLLSYSDARDAEWNHDWTSPDDPDRLVYYVPPHYALLQAESPDAKRTNLRFPNPKHDRPSDQGLDEGTPSIQRVSGPTEEETLCNLLKSSDRLCVCEGPGAGKSIFTRRLQAFLSTQYGRDALFDGKPALAVRWEEWDGSWPDDFHVSLARQLEPYCEAADIQIQARVLAEAALAERRVVLILDALDQVGTEDRIRCLSDFLTESRQRGWRLRIVMTARPFAVEQRKSTLLRDAAWQFACIEDFDADQQYRYLYGPKASPAQAGKKSEAWTSRDLSGFEIRRLVPGSRSFRTTKRKRACRSCFPTTSRCPT